MMFKTDFYSKFYCSQLKIKIFIMCQLFSKSFFVHVCLCMTRKEEQKQNLDFEFRSNLYFPSLNFPQHCDDKVHVWQYQGQKSMEVSCLCRSFFVLPCKYQCLLKWGTQFDLLQHFGACPKYLLLRSWWVNSYKHLAENWNVAVP